METGTVDKSELFSSKLTMRTCPKNPEIFSLIFIFNHTPVAMETSITIIPKATAITPILVIGEETLFL